MSRIAPYVRSAKRAWDLIDSAARPVPIQSMSFPPGSKGFLRAKRSRVSRPIANRRLAFRSAINRLARRRGRAARRYGKSGRIRGRMGKRKQILDLITASNYYNVQVADQVTIPASDATVGMSRLFFTVNTSISGGQIASIPFGAQDPFYMRSIAGLITSAVQPSIRFEIKSFRIAHTISNQSSGDIRLKGWLCRCRRDLPSLAPYSESIQSVIGDGFATSGVDNTNPSNTNQGLRNRSVSLFQSPTFVSAFQVVKSRTVTLRPGGNTIFRYSAPAFSVLPNQFVRMSAGQGYLAGTILLEWRRGETFWLFEASLRDVPNRTADRTLIQQPSSKLNMITDFSYEYKYIDDYRQTITAAAPVRVNDGSATTSDLMQPSTVGALAMSTA